MNELEHFKGDGFDAKRLGSRSWADSKWGKVFARELAERLEARCEGVQSLFLTLTYKRDEYADAADLWHRQRQERHVRRFFEDLGEIMRTELGLLGNPLTGKWLCKLEFQQGGWVHWHCVIVGVPFIPKEHIDRAWGRGFTWIVRARKRELRYVAKYVSKVGSLPSFVLADRVRSLKVVRVSPGFWDEGPCRVYTYDDGDGPKPKHPVYRSIAQAISERNDQTVIRTSDGTWCRSDMKYEDLVLFACSVGAKLVAGPRGWTRLVGRTIDAVNRERGPLAKRVAPLHLIQLQNPPPDKPKSAHAWDVPYIARLIHLQDKESRVA